jgi:hypothetical protein
MDRQDYKVRREVCHQAVAFGAIAIAGVGTLLAFASKSAFLWEPSFETWFLPWAAAGILILPGLLLLPWRAFLRIDDEGVTLFRSEGRPSARLAWEEVEEIFDLGSGQLELRGGGRRIQISSRYDLGYQAAHRSLRRVRGPLGEKLRRRAREEGELVFRMPSRLWTAHVVYLMTVLVLSALTLLCLVPLTRKGETGFPYIFVFGGFGSWGLRRWASGRGARLTLLREGFLLRRLDGTVRIPWDQLSRVESNGAGGLDLILRSGREHSLPADLGNLQFLEKMVREKLASADSFAR